MSFLFFEYVLDDAFEQRNIAIDAHLQKQIAELSTMAQQIADLLWMSKARHSSFGQRINMHDCAAFALCLLQRRQHARMIRPGILTDDKDRLREIEVFKPHSSF